MSDNIVQQVASGNAPQPSADVAVDSNYDQLQSDMEDAIDGEEAVEASPSDEVSPESKIDAAVEAGKLTKVEAKELKKKFQLKVDGEDYEEELDWNNEEQVKRHLQKSRAFDKRVKEFSGFKSQVDTLLEQLQNDPEAVLEKLGMNVDEMAEKRLQKKIEQMKKSPEQIKQEKLEEELSTLRKEKKDAEELREKAELEKMRNEQAQAIQDDISGALENSKSILPKKNPSVFQLME